MKYLSISVFVIVFGIYAIIAPPIIKNIIDKKNKNKTEN